MRNTELFDAYLNNLMSPAQKINFEAQLKIDADLAAEFNQHKLFIQVLQECAERNAFKLKLKNLAKETSQPSNLIKLPVKEEYNYRKVIGIAASVAALTALVCVGVLSVSGFLVKKQNSNYTALSKELSSLKTTQQAIISGFSKIGNSLKRKSEANFQASGFLINEKGYFITSLHVVNRADSIFIANKNMEPIAARIVHTNKRLDIALLKLESDSIFKGVPYTLKNSELELGERVFTLGYPSDDIVYGEGSVSSASGFSDTAMYQVSIPLNRGNSGGPLLDEQGNIVGIISGKNINAEGTGYAVKAAYINEMLSIIDKVELKKELQFSSKNTVKFLKRKDQIKKISPFVFNIYVYRQN